MPGRTGQRRLAVSLGSVESLIEHPARMTHCTTAGTPVGVSDSLLRLSIGLEDCDELIADLGQALADLTGAHGPPPSGAHSRGICVTARGTPTTSSTSGNWDMQSDLRQAPGMAHFKYLPAAHLGPLVTTASDRAGGRPRCAWP